jgi:SNF2 family DNA or RNA helicase
VTSGKGNGPRGSQRILGNFLSSHASEHPVLVISYEMFRTFAVAFNTLSSLEVLLCDEGHRLKNAYGTSTTLALGNCCAMRRLVLTGMHIYIYVYIYIYICYFQLCGG